MGVMGGDLSAEQAEARRQATAEHYARKADAAYRKEIIFGGQRRPDSEFLGLGVVVKDGDVLVWSTTINEILGTLAGAEAGIAGPVKIPGTGGRRAGVVAASAVTFGVVGGAVAVAATRGPKSFAYVVFADGTLHQEPLTSKQLAVRAQADALRFNAIAAAAGHG